MADGIYGFDANSIDIDNDPEEAIALAGTIGFEAPETVRADHIYVDGTQLRYADLAYSGLIATGAASYAATDPALGSLALVRGYAAATIIAGTAYGSEASGVRAATIGEFSNRDAFVLTDGAGTGRFPIRAGTDGGDVPTPLSIAEARAVLEDAFTVMTRARAQIRQPLDSRAQVTISLVDTRGAVLGIVRSPDAPMFGTDVSLQKARTAAFMSHKFAAQQLLADPSSDVQHFVATTRTFLKDPTALTGATAFGDRSVGLLARPHFPDGEIARPNGPLSRPIAQFNPFSTGLQSALVLTNLAQHLGFVTGASGTDTPTRCTFLPDASAGQNRLQNGLQIFPGSVPIYRGSTLIGAIGVSGDGIDQDDMISFLGLANAGSRIGGIANAPTAIRADQVEVDLGDSRVRLRYVSCPFAPFVDTSAQNVCSGF